MLLRELLRNCGPWAVGTDPDAIAGRVEGKWKGARVFMTRPAVARAWATEGRPPRGAAERLAHDIEVAVLAEGGDRSHIERCLLAVMTDRIIV